MSTSAQELVLDAFMAVADSSTLRAALYELAYRYAREIENNETPDVASNPEEDYTPDWPNDWPSEQLATDDLYRIEF